MVNLADFHRPDRRKRSKLDRVIDSRTLTPQGSLDPSFGSGGKTPPGTGVTSAAVRQILTTRDGTLLTGNSNGTSLVAFQRIKGNGQRDSNFGSNGIVNVGFSAAVASMTLQPNEQILAILGDTNGTRLLSLNSISGHYDTDFGIGGYRQTASLAGYPAQLILISQPDRN